MNDTDRKTQIVLVDDQRMTRDGLRALFGPCPDMEVVGESSTQALALANIPKADVVIIVVGVGRKCPHPTAIVEPILRRWPQVRIVAISAIPNRALLGGLLQAGVHGCVTAQCASDELFKAVRTVVSGSRYLCPAATTMLLGGHSRHEADGNSRLEVPLTDRECAVLALLSEGRTSNEIATTLGLSSKTIDACRRHLMRKLEVDSMAGLVKCAIMMEMTAVAPLSHLRSRPNEKPLLILLAWDVPDGDAFLEALKADEELRMVPVVVLAESKETSEVTASFARGAAGYMIKTANPTQLYEEVAAIHAYWALSELPRP